MNSDEQEIRELVATWMRATKAGDVETVLGLMTDDVAFLVPGRAPMRKKESAAGARAQADWSAAKFEGTSESQEIKVVGDWAFMWSRLKVIAISPDGSTPTEREGHRLTVLQRERASGCWRATPIYLLQRVSTRHDAQCCAAADRRTGHLRSRARREIVH